MWRWIELPRAGSSYGPQITVLNVTLPVGVAVDGVGNLFVTSLSFTPLVKLPWTGSDYGAQTTLPISGVSQPSGVAVDGAGNIFVADPL